MNYPTTQRISALAFDGSWLFSADTHQQMGDSLCTYEDAGFQPPVAYTHDCAPGVAYPYMTWNRPNDGGCVRLIGTQHRTREDVLKYFKELKWEN